jgi:hypothetical protein
MVAISLSGSGEGPGGAIPRGYSTTIPACPPVSHREAGFSGISQATSSASTRRRPQLRRPHKIRPITDAPVVRHRKTATRPASMATPWTTACWSAEGSTYFDSSMSAISGSTVAIQTRHASIRRIRSRVRATTNSRATALSAALKLAPRDLARGQTCMLNMGMVFPPRGAGPRPRRASDSRGRRGSLSRSDFSVHVRPVKICRAAGGPDRQPAC